MTRFSRTSFFLLVGVGVWVGTGAAQASPPTLRIPRVSRPPKLEDFLNNTPREAEAVVTGFRQRDPGDGVPVSEPTTAYLSYDDKNLYVVFVCKDEPGKVRARMAKREDINSDDVVGILLDTFHDRRRAYIFGTNPLGIQLDGITTEGQNDDYSFDTLWHSEGRLTPDGFIVWMAIPFKSLRFSGDPEQTWGIALLRSIERKNETSFWPYVTRRVEGFAQQMATLQGLDRISPSRNLQFIPYGILTRARFLDPLAPGGPALRTDNDARGGLDAKFILRDALTLDVALNPDFSQVESDDPQVLVNQRFEVFFPEKRPFFIENAGFFQTPINLFFSRRIVDPQFGTRLTGKVGHWALGGLLIDDRPPKSDPLHGDRAGIGMARVQREFASQSFLGLFVSSRDLGPTSNRLFSLDTRIKLNPNWVLTGQAVSSYTRQLDGTHLVGPAYFAELRRNGRHLIYLSRYEDRSPNFRSRLGFIPRVNIRQFSHFLDYSWRPERRRLVSFGPSAFTLVNWDRQGRVQDWIAQVGFGMFFTGQTGLEITRKDAFELFQNLGFRKHSTLLNFSTEWLKWLAISASYNQGTNVNFFPPAPLLPFLANQENGSLGFALRPTPRFRFEQTYLYSRLGTRKGSLPQGSSTSAGIFNNHILRSKLNYQFTRELSLRAIFDYNALLANTNLLSVDPTTQTKRFTADFLLTYLLHPGTAFYVGYTDRHDNLDIFIDPTTRIRSLSRIGSPTTSTGRQFFVKVSYLFRF